MVENSETEYDFRLCTSASELCAAYNLRIEVFHEEQKFSKELEVDNYDAESAHFILVSKNNANVVATIRLTPKPTPSTNNDLDTFKKDQLHMESPLGCVRSETTIIDAFLKKLKSQVVLDEAMNVKLSRLAVRKEMRGKGVGSVIVKEAEKWLLKVLGDSDNIQNFTIILSSQMQAKNFYEKIGYVCEGEPYDEEGMLHILCKKEFTFDNQKKEFSD